MPEALLSGVCLEAPASPVSRGYFLQSFCGTGKRGCHSSCSAHKKVLLGKCTGISFVDSTPLKVCKNQRIHIHKTFRGIAQRDKCSMGWLFGFKQHFICNEKGELLNFMITPGDINDRKQLEHKAFVEFMYGKLVGDKGIMARIFPLSVC